MGRKCLIKGCRTGYALSKEEKENGIDKRETLKTFSFPNKTKHLEERERWLKVIPFWKPSEIEAMTTPVICEKHWPVGFAEKKGDRGKLRPVDPPSVFEMTPISTIPTPPPKERPTKKTTFETRTRQEDQFDKFKLMDVVDYKILLEAVNTSNKSNNNIPSCVIAYECERAVWIQSKSFISGIPAYSIKIFENLSFVTFQLGIRCTVMTHPKNENNSDGQLF